MRKIGQALLVAALCSSIVPGASGLHLQKPSLIGIKSSMNNGAIGKNVFLRRNGGRRNGEKWDNRKNAEGLSMISSSSLKMVGGSASTSVSSSASNQNKGRLLLILVAFLYGSLNVAFKMIYAMPNPPMASTLSVARGWLAAATFIPIIMTAPKETADAEPVAEAGKKKPPLWKAALELAFWNFGAQGLLNIGLLFTDASRASFLTQMSVVITPIISMFAGQTVPKIVWAGCAAALSGLVVMSGAIGGAATAGASLAFSSGDLLVLGGALSWSMYLFRIASVGKRYAEIPLQAIKTTLLATLYSVWFAFSALTLAFTPGATVASLWPGWKNITAWALLLYSAVGPGAIADVLQQQGQKEVSASEANVILSSEPIFTAICARLILGEITTTTENIGGGLIIFGALLASGA